MILDELMPWHKEKYDFGLLEVTGKYKIDVVIPYHSNVSYDRSWSHILGFSKETLVWNPAAICVAIWYCLHM